MTEMLKIIILILFIPLVVFITVSILGRFIGYKGTVFISFTFYLLSLLLLSIFLYQFYLSAGRNIEEYYLTLGAWINTEDLNINFTFVLNSINVLMIFVVFSVSFCVHVFSYSYMKLDPHFNRFISYLSLFTFFMLIFVTADSMLVLFVGWEGVGLCSYLLVGFWNTRSSASLSALKALFYNRVGDLGIILALSILFFYCRTLDFSTIKALTPYLVGIKLAVFGYNIKVLSLVGVLLFLGVVGKSAQLGLHAWLPDAMEGPTPVSALIHAATMVTAGIFLIIKMSFFFEFIPLVLMLMLFVGSMTAFTAALIAFMQDDLKKIIAFSTCSQLGYMVFMCGLSQYDFAFYHLINHAFFKALLFLSSGVIIHLYNNSQDIRKINGVREVSWLLTIIFLLGVFSLEGFFYFSSVESKDVILELSAYKFIIGNNYVFIFSIITIFLTSMYASNLIDICINSYDFNKKIKLSFHKINFMLVIPLVILSILTILSNFLYSHFFSAGIFNIFTHSTNNQILNTDILPFYFKLFLIIIPSVFLIPHISIKNYYKLHLKITKIVDCFVREFLYIDYLMWSTIYFNLNIFTIDFFHKNAFLIIYFGIYFWRRFTKFYDHWYSDDYSDFTIALAIGIIVGLNYDQLSILHILSFITFQFNYKLWSLMSIFTFNFDILFFLVIFREFGLETLDQLRFWHALGFYKIKQYFDLLYHKFYFDVLVNEILVLKIFKKGSLYYLFIDKGFLEFFGPDGIAITSYRMLKNIKTYFSGYTYNYICLFGIILIYVLTIISLLV